MADVSRLRYLVLLTVLSTLVGCKGNNPYQGITVASINVIRSSNGVLGLPLPAPFVTASGEFSADQHPYSGTVGSFLTTTGESSSVYISDAKAPGYWSFVFSSNQYCGTRNLSGTGAFGQARYSFPNQPMVNLGTFTFECIYDYIPGATSRFEIAGSLPPTITLNPIGTFTTQFGNPEMYIYDGNSNIVADVIATTVDPNGNSATFPLPSSLRQSGYAIAVVNQAENGTKSNAGFNLLSVATSNTLSGKPYGVAVAGITDSTADQFYVDCDDSQPTEGNNPGNPGGGSLPNRPECVAYANFSNYLPVPIVSLYASNQVLISGTNLVSVGTSPTMVVTYPSDSVSKSSADSSGSYNDTFTGNTRAAVINSGDNSISIIDLINATLISTIAVGAQPTAIAVDAGGNYAYVANYGDGTVSRVDLHAQSVVSVVAMSSSPTSLAITASGVLWVGGNNYLSQVDSNSMRVQSTQISNSTAFIGLAYSNSVEQVIANVVDSNGGIHLDQVAPANFAQNSNYVPIASSIVSRLQPYTISSNLSPVLAYSNTAAASLLPIRTLPGASPLVIQDGWAVVTASPTGFTITDITGNIVLVSEQTTSPINAIAMDPQLNVVYMTMPDTNTLLTVPLPGVR